MVDMVFRNVLTAAFFVLSIPALSTSAIIYVDQDAVGANNGSSWSDAFTDFQNGLSAAVSGDEIWVSEGTYRPSNVLGGSGDVYKSFQMKNEVEIYGGFAGYETKREQRNYQNNLTILSCDIGVEDDDSDNCYHVFYHGYLHSTNLDNTAILDGFTITGARNYLVGGGGMYNFNDSPTIRNSVFMDNQVGRGSGMLNENSSPIITNCSFIDNTALHGNGGGVSNLGSLPEFTNCLFKNNSAIGGSGGGMYNSDSQVIIKNCRFFNNSSSMDQGSGGLGGGIYNDYMSHPTVINNVFYGNTADYRGGGVHSHDAKQPLIIVNNIFWDNNAPTGEDFDYWYYWDGSPPKVIFNNMSTTHAGQGNISGIPLFVDPASDDFHLQQGSPCINAGTNDGALGNDIDGDPRPLFIRTDIGVDEYTGWVEDFESVPINFVDNSFFTVSGGRLHFDGDSVSDPEGTPWNGGDMPGGGWPQYGDSNYFENFVVSADTFWEDHFEVDGYGVFTSSVGAEDPGVPRSNVTFSINKSGQYLITQKKDDVASTIVGWTKSSLLSPDGQDNQLSVKKVGPYYHFYIDEIEVERRIIEGFHGGGVGLYSMRTVDVSFDNFTVGTTSYNDFEDDSNNVLEDFGAGSGGFSENENFSIQNESLLFTGDDTDYLRFQIWNGGFNPGGWSAEPEDTNYFEYYTVSIIADWQGGEVDHDFGLVVDTNENVGETGADYINFLISQDGWYIVSKRINDAWQTLSGWQPSAAIITGGAENTLSVEKDKDDSEYRFLINGTVVYTLPVSEGFTGGGIGVQSSMHVDVSYDDFTITQPGIPPVADAGTNQAVTEGDTVSLNGSGSSDDTAITSYKWYQLQGPTVTLSDLTVANPTFTAPEFTIPTTILAFQLQVTDGDRLHDSDITLVEVGCVNVTGDVDGNCVVDLKDAIIPLQVVTGGDAADVRSDYDTSGVDVSGDNQVGIEEAINALRSEAGF